MITCLVEDWPRYYNDPQREALWWEHYRELEAAHEGRMPMSPDVASYAALERNGHLVTIVARRDGQMIGYCLAVIRRHLHYDALCGFEDAYFVTASARDSGKGMIPIGYKLIGMMVAEMRRRGCLRGYFMTKEFASIAALFERMGMQRMDSVYTIWLKD